MSIVRPGKDRLHLVTVVQSSLEEKAGYDLCNRFNAQAQATLVDTEVNVLLKGAQGTLGQIDEFVDKIEANLVIMGSEALSQPNVPIGSISVG